MNYFGTDGIRRKADEFDGELLRKVSAALTVSARKKTFLIARDTRISGERIEDALVREILGFGGSVVSVGMTATPVCAHLTRALNVDCGIMISASHNPPEYNGIKLFNGRGEKLTTEEEELIDGYVSQEPILSEVIKEGNHIVYEGANVRYIDDLKAVLKGVSLVGLKVVLDTANGAMSEVAPRFFRELGAEVTVINNSLNGQFINCACGATNVSALAETLAGGGYDLGFAYDGDGDRVVMIKNGRYFDGDHLMYVLARDLKEKGKLSGNTAVMTVLGNFGVEEALGRVGIRVARSAVGDKYVAELLLTEKYAIGSEASGHIIIPEYLHTGDGLLASILIAEIALKEDIALIDDIVEYPQYSENVPLKNADAAEITEKLAALNLAEVLKTSGVRLLVRKSGTEPVMRVMTEGKSAESAELALKTVSAVIKSIVAKAI